MVFLVTTESQDLSLTSHPKDGAFYFILCRPNKLITALDPVLAQDQQPESGARQRAAVLLSTRPGVQINRSECNTRAQHEHRTQNNHNKN